ncbi:MAG TPA: alpha/beta fold hydrolase [Pyrinomonadaceae bacterium]|nr:alpha/beta fold hydrolase [Pyrinomonadaceae bacterium]
MGNFVLRGLFFFLLLCGFIMPSYAAQSPIDGYWEGVGKLPGDEFQIAVTFKTEAQGIKATIDIPDSGILGWSLTDVSTNAAKVHFVFPTDLGSIPFDGDLRGDTITGTFQFGKSPIPFVLQRSAVKPLPYREEEIHFRNGNVTLAGTLLLPDTKAPHPAIVFHHGAYADTRNAWRFYADHFARHGIACLIYDNRGAGDSTGYSRAGFEDLAADALAGVELLKRRGEINHKQIGLFAGSQGGWISPLAASHSKDVAFIMLVAGPGVTVARNVLYESETKLRDRGFSEEEIKRALSVKKLIEDTARMESWEKAEPIIQKAKDEKWFSVIGVPDKNSWFRWWWTLVGNYDPAPVWEKITIPVINVEGELDKNVPVEESLVRMENALIRARNKDYTIKVFPKADHSIMVVSEQGRPRLAPGYLDFMTEWLLKRVSTKS